MSSLKKIFKSDFFEFSNKKDKKAKKDNKANFDIKYSCSDSDNESKEFEITSNIELKDLTVSFILNGLNSGSFTSEQLVYLYLDRVKKINPKLEELIYINPHALKEARKADRRRKKGDKSPLLGLPLINKNGIPTDFIPSNLETPSILGKTPTKNCLFIDNLLKAGVVIIANSHCSETWLDITGINFATLNPKNPFNPNLWVGGSGGGSAGSIASLLGPIATSADAGGSNRTPASNNGMTGWRPTATRYANRGTLFPNSNSGFATAGFIGRNVRDISIMDSVIVNGDIQSIPKSLLTTLRIGVPANMRADLENEMIPVINNALNRLAINGVTLVETSDIPDVSTLFLYNNIFVGIFFQVIISTFFVPYLQIYFPDVSITEFINNVVSPQVKDVLALCLLTPDPTILNLLLAQQQTLIANYNNYFSINQLDAIIYPTIEFTARPAQNSSITTGINFNGTIVTDFPDILVGIALNRTLAPIVQVPAISIPIGFSNGMPFGIDIAGLHNQDTKILSIAEAFEQIFKPLDPPSLEYLYNTPTLSLGEKKD
jgi:Asp-tRNA(Asn)/Glu-tRNA(Gln) amidotransferase A subunit family amidase